MHRDQMVTTVPQEILNAKIIPRTPVGHPGKPEEEVALVLGSEGAAFVTGADIAINDSQHLQ
ncbi:hypothetical protein CS8_095990 [Cupriavidus sp. 8B]